MKKERITHCRNCGKHLTKIQISKRGQFCCHGCATSYRQSAHDPNIFEIENKDILYYLLGLIFTDGNLDKDESRITLSLTQQEIIDKLYPYFCDTLSRKIYEYQPKNCKNANKSYTIINTNKNTIQKLKDMSLTSNNSTTKDFPNIPIEYTPAFLRGIFDGDGCIVDAQNYKDKKYKRVSITCASLIFVEKLTQLLKTFELTPTIVIDSRRKDKQIKTYYVCLNRQNDINWFYNYIYNNATIYIKYKRQRFE